MPETRMSPLRILVGVAFLMAVVASGCAETTGANLRAWIDVPTDGALIAAGTNVDVQSHAYAREGVAEVMLTVNGEPVRRDPAAAPGATFTASTQPWLPPGPGEYKLAVIAYDTTGAASEPSVVHVKVIIPATETPTPTLTPTVIPTVTATVTPIPSVTPTLTPVPQAEARFWADSTSLAPGDCTLLHWDVVAATAVTLDGISVPAQGNQNACPQTTTTYRLHVTALSGNLERSVTLTVAAPADTAGPDLSGVSNAPGFIWDASSCGPAEATITAQASDPSGVSQVVLYYRVLRGGKSGTWGSLSMGGSGAYQATLGPAQLNASLPNYGGGQVEYYVIAADARGNSTTSSTHSFEAKLCFG